MKTNYSLFNLLFCVVLGLFTVSCSSGLITKRKHRKGYHWETAFNVEKKQSKTDENYISVTPLSDLKKDQEDLKIANEIIIHSSVIALHEAQVLFMKEKDKESSRAAKTVSNLDASIHSAKDQRQTIYVEKATTFTDHPEGTESSEKREESRAERIERRLMTTSGIMMLVFGLLGIGSFLGILILISGPIAWPVYLIAGLIAVLIFSLFIWFRKRMKRPRDAKQRWLTWFLLGLLSLLGSIGIYYIILFAPLIAQYLLWVVLSPLFGG